MFHNLLILRYITYCNLLLATIVKKQNQLYFLTTKESIRVFTGKVHHIFLTQVHYLINQKTLTVCDINSLTEFAVHV